MYDYNFFSNYKGKRKPKGTQGGRVLILIFLLTVVVLGGLVFWIRDDLKQLNERNDGLKATIQLPANQELMARFNEKQTLLTELETQVTELSASEVLLVADNRIQQPLIDALVSALPVDAQVNEWVITSEVVSLSGLAAQRSAIAEYQYSLRQVSFVQEVYVSYISSTEEGFNFSMTISIGGDAYENLD